MNPNTPDPPNPYAEERARRFAAYFLGDLDDAERAAVETEMRAHPSLADQARATVEGLRRWAAEPVPYTPLDIDAVVMDAEEIQPGDPSLPVIREPLPASVWSEASEAGAMAGAGVRSWLPGRWAWSLAAAALLVFSLTQTQFSFRMGQSEFHWGRPAPAPPAADDALKADLISLSSRVDALSSGLDLTAGQIREVSTSAAVNDALLAEQVRTASDQLYRLLATEARTRHRDMTGLLQMAGYYDEPRWTSASTLPDENSNPAMQPVNFNGGGAPPRE